MTISAYRTVTWRPALAGQLAAPPLAWPNKMPADAADYTLDISRYLADPVDTVASCTAFTTATGLTIGTVAIVGGLLTVTVSGGSLGLTYPVDLVAVTNGGHTADFRVLMPIGPGASRTQASYVPSVATPSTPGLVRPGLGFAVEADGTITYAGGPITLGQFQALRLADVAALPTTPPTTSGVRWLNSGVETIS